jgi:hypothetical protein
LAGFHPILRGWFYSTHHDARYCTAVIVYYPLHPHFRRGELPVCRRRGIGNVQHVEVQVDGVQQAVPVWMTDEQLCKRLTMGLMPYCSSASLLELLALLRSTGL